MPFHPSQPYNDLPALPPAAELETNRILKKAISANKALAGLRGVGHLIPNQAILVQTLGLQEAKLSSAIENIVTTNDELYLAFGDHLAASDAHTKEVLYYTDALWYGYHTLKKKKRLLTTLLFEELVQMIKKNSDGIRKLPGTRLSTPAGEIIYTPPEGQEIIRQKLANLEQFIYAKDSIDPLVKMAVIHYQFEAIHPFNDGNGRTGRILNILYLIEMGILDIPVLYLSHYIISNKSEYYLGIRKVTEEQAWEPWLLFMLHTLEQTAITTQEKIIALHRLLLQTADEVKKKLPKLYSKELIEAIFWHPYCKIRFLEEAAIAKRETASLYLQKLEKIGILRSIKIGRDKYYINETFLKMLSE